MFTTERTSAVDKDKRNKKMMQVTGKSGFHVRNWVFAMSRLHCLSNSFNAGRRKLVALWRRVKFHATVRKVHLHISNVYVSRVGFRTPKPHFRMFLTDVYCIGI